MTMFEKICDEIGACFESEAAEALAEIVNDLIFNTEMDDEEICKEAVKRFREKYE